MTDYVSEIRPKALHKQPPNLVRSNGEFVAEIRARQINHSDFRLRNRDCFSEGISDQDLNNILSGGNFSREEIIRILKGSIMTLVEKLLTGRSISQIYGNLNIYLSNDSLPLVINLNEMYSENPNSFNRNVQTLKDSLNVNIKSQNLAACQGNDRLLLSPFFVLQTGLGNGVIDKYMGPNINSDNSAKNHENNHSDKNHIDKNHTDKNYTDKNHTDKNHTEKNPADKNHADNRQFDHCITQAVQIATANITSSPEEFNIAAEAEDTRQPLTKSETLSTHALNDSDDDDSGYTSNEKDDPDRSSNERSPSPHSNMYNEYYCNGLDDKNKECIPYDYGPLVTKTDDNLESSNVTTSNDIVDDDEEDEFDHRFVIDENLFLEMSDSCSTTSKLELCKELGQPMDVDSVDVITIGECEIDRMQQNVYYQDGARICIDEDMDDTDYPHSSDDTDFRNSSDVTDVEFHDDFPESHSLIESVDSSNQLQQRLLYEDGSASKHGSYDLDNNLSFSKLDHAQNGVINGDVSCRIFTPKNSLKRQTRLHSWQKQYKRKQCTQTLIKEDDFMDHVVRPGVTNSFRCSECRKGFSVRGFVKNHMVNEHGSRLIHICPQCGESYDQEEKYAAHKRTHPELLQFSCTTCSYIGTNKHMIQKHSLLHLYKVFSCKPCNAYFADPFDYTHHIRTHKKTSSFSTYRCCFCDISLPTYDRYIRHEYTHAQGKIHLRKTCKKQFKSKTSIQGHSVDYRDESNISQISATSTQNMSSSWRRNNDLDILSNPKSINLVENTKPLPRLDIQSLTPQAEHCEKFEGQLLDLSMKKPEFCNSHNQKEEKCFVPRTKDTEFGEINFPRNGVVLSELCNLERGDDEDGASLTMKQEVCQTERPNSMDDTFDSSMKCDWNYSGYYSGISSPSSISSANSDTNGCLYQNVILNTRPIGKWNRHVIDSSADKANQLRHRASQDCVQKASFRFNPFSREKFADLAAKFVAARGTKFLKNLSVNPLHWEKMQDTAVPIERDYRKEDKADNLNPLPFQHVPYVIGSTDAVNGSRTTFQKQSSTGRSNGTFGDEKVCIENVREVTNPETALMYHAPVLVKSELPLEMDHCIKVASKSKSLNAKDGEHWQTSNNNGSPLDMAQNTMDAFFQCDECKKVFGLFSDLENHCMEMHKRFLCEYCRKSFTARPNRDRHVRYHTGERPYKCDLCDMAFFRGDDLKYHRTTRHHTAQPFVCSDCNVSFSWKRDLDRHIRHSKCKT